MNVGTSVEDNETLTIYFSCLDAILRPTEVLKENIIVMHGKAFLLKHLQFFNSRHTYACPPGRKHDSIRFRRLLCPDPSCEVCNTATSEISQLLFPEVLEDASLFVSPLASTALVADSSPTLSPASSVAPAGDLIPSSLLVSSPPPLSIPSPNPVTPLDEFLAPSPLGYSLPPEPFPLLDSQFPVTLSSPKSPPFPPPLPHCMQRVDPALQTGLPVPLKTMYTVDPIMFPDIGPLSDLAQTVNLAGSYACQQAPPTLPVLPAPDCTLTVTQSQSVSILLKPVQEKPSANSAGGLCAYVPAMTGIDHSSLSISQFSLWQAHAKKLFCSTFPQGEFNQEFLALRSSETSFGRHPAANLIEPGNLSFSSPEVLALLEQHIQNKINSLMWEEKEKGCSFLKQPRPEYQLNPTGKMSQMVASKAESVSLSLLKNESRPKDLQMHEQSLNPMSFHNNLLQKPIQFFCGLPSLHSESLSTAIYPSRDLSSIWIFNGIFNASIDQEPLVPLHPSSLSLPEVHSPISRQTPLKSQLTPVLKVEPQATLQLPLSNISTGTLPQMRICGVFFHRLQEEAEPLSSSDIQSLEWHVLQKRLTSLWGSSSLVQRYEENFSPLPPKSPARQASRVHISISILPGEFPLSKELRKKLEHHLKKRLIQHRWGLPHRIYESLSLMMPPNDFVQTSESGNKSKFSVTMQKSQSKQNITAGSSPSGSFHEIFSSMSVLEEDLGETQGQVSEKRPNKHSLNDPEKSSDLGLGSNSEANPNNYILSHSSKKQIASEERVPHKQFENSLKAHLSKKFEEINEGQFPNVVHSSWHTLQQSEKSNTNVNQGNLSSMDFSLKATKQHHIQKSHRKASGLCPKVSKSIQRSCHSNLLSANMIPEGNYKSGDLKNFRGLSQEDKVGIKNVGSVFDHHVPATSPIGKEGQGVLRQSPFDNNQELVEVQRSKGDRPSLLPVKRNLIESQRQSFLPNRSPQKLPSWQAADRQEPKFHSISSSDRLEMPERKEIANKELFSNAAISREIFRAKELDALQSEDSTILIGYRPGSSQTLSANERKAASTKRLPPKISVLPDSNSPELKEKLIDELKLELKSREKQLAQGQPVDMSSTSDSLTHEDSLTHAQGFFTGDEETSQVLHVYMEDSGFSMEQEKEPWVPEHVLRCQDKDFPPDVMSTNCTGPKSAAELGGGDAEQASPQPGSRCFPSKYIPLKVYESKNSKLSPRKGQHPPENLFRQKFKDFWQWIYPRTKYMKQNSQVKGSSISSPQSRGPIKSRAATTRKIDTQKYINDTGKPLDKKVGHRHANYTTSLEKSSLPPGKSGIKQKTEGKAQKVCTHGYFFNPKAVSSIVINCNSCSQAPVIAGLANPASQGVRGTDRHPQKAFKDTVVCPRHNLHMVQRRSLAPTIPPCRWQADQCSKLKGFALSDMSFQRNQLFKQKMILQKFQGWQVLNQKQILYGDY
ncbi:spermatogenesis-associated protein 31D4-like [Erinaceus europaeus]|uniref:Spermatogenesis-associated protein 31D4-like n=1 Tax=Erinaceus europaeus TaxID=9365 RepID=A0ABM3Y1N9_ERIEU|nr:spermatogenesis-associated protein 31D4-like [Erinaceus europaeus]